MPACCRRWPTGWTSTIPTAGYLVSGYAIGIAVGGPLLTLATARFSRKILLIGAGRRLHRSGRPPARWRPISHRCWSTRVAVAVAHGAYFGVAMVVAVGLVRKEQRGMAVALILAGLTVSNIIGVPAGTAIGNVWGWRVHILGDVRARHRCHDRHDRPAAAHGGCLGAPPPDWAARYACWGASRCGPR